MNNLMMFSILGSSAILMFCLAFCLIATTQRIECRGETTLKRQLQPKRNVELEVYCDECPRHLCNEWLKCKRNGRVGCSKKVSEALDLLVDSEIDNFSKIGECPEETFALLAHKQPCLDSSKEDCAEDGEIVDQRCHVTEWSDWSNCSVTCGHGVRVRFRRYLHDGVHNHCNVSLYQKAPCTGLDTESSSRDCSQYDLKRAKETCMKPEDPGLCKMLLPRWYYDLAKGQCLKFTFGGCGGNENKFPLYQDCVKECAIPMLVIADMNRTKEICTKPKETGPCRAYIPSWYYDADKGQCLKFGYGGCKGNENRFERHQDCEKDCAIPMQANLMDSDSIGKLPGGQ